MKKYFFIFCLFGIYNVLFAQMDFNENGSVFYAGLTGGLNYGQITTDNNISNFGPYDKPLTKYTTGLSLAYLRADNWGFQTGIRYARSGGKTENMVGTSETGQVNGKFWIEQELSYLEVPLLLSYRVKLEKLVPYAFGGPNIRFLLDADERMDADYDGQQWSQNIKDKMKSVQMDLEGGLGVMYPLNSRVNAGISAAYLYGLSNQLENKDDGEQKTRDVRLMCSLSYRLN